MSRFAEMMDKATQIADDKFSDATVIKPRVVGEFSKARWAGPSFSVDGILCEHTQAIEVQVGRQQPIGAKAVPGEFVIFYRTASLPCVIERGWLIEAKGQTYEVTYAIPDGMSRTAVYCVRKF